MTSVSSEITNMQNQTAYNNMLTGTNTSKPKMQKLYETNPIKGLENNIEELAKKYDIKFLYRDFRVGFREGQNKARELDLYMQKYCGCVFSEEDRYSKQIEKDKIKFNN